MKTRSERINNNANVKSDGDKKNVKNFRQFYLTWPSDTILYTLCGELSWSHIRLIMRLDTENARVYYLNESRSQGWSVRILERNARYLRELGDVENES